MAIRKLIVPALLMLLFVGAFMPTGGPMGRAYQLVAQPLASVTDFLLTPGKAAFSFVTSSLRDRGDRAVEVEQLLELHQQVMRDAQLLQLHFENVELRNENAALKRLRARFADRDYQLLVPSVVGRRFDATAHTLTLSHGTVDGIRDGQVVVVGASLVGKVVRAGRSTATVELISTPGTRLNTIVGPINWAAAGISAEERQFEAEGADRLVGYVPNDVRIEVGHIAYLRDRMDWPDQAQGFAVGQVVEVTPVTEPQLRQRIVLRPLRPYRFINKVMVIVTQPAVEAPDEAQG
jgi:cell shape-determining protein MreC